MVRPGIRLRVFLAIMSVIGGLLLLTCWIMDDLVDGYMDTEIADTLHRGRRAYERFAAVRNTVLADQARSLAQAPHLRAVLGTPDVDEQTVHVTLSALGETVGGSLLFVTDASGRLVADNRDKDDLPDLQGMGELRAALAGSESSGIWNYAGSDYLVAISPINVDSTQLGALGLGYPIGAHAAELGDATGLDVAILRDGLVVASSSSAAPDAEKRENRPAPSWSDLAPDANARLQVEGREVMAASLSLASPSYRLVLSRPLDNLQLQFRNAKQELMLVGLAIAGVALLVSRWLANRIAGPIRALTNAAIALARGDLTAHVSVASSDGDEIDTLGRTFNSMARQLESAMREVLHKARAAEQASEAKSAFLATMSHELRTPLNAILGFNEQLRNTELTTEQQDYARTAQSSGEELLALIDKLLDFARLQSGGSRLDRVEFDVHDCIHRAVDKTSAAIRKKGLTLDLEISPAVPQVAFGPMREVQQVLLHYLSNAERFTSKGSIRLRASLAGQTEETFLLRVEVEDTGIGVAAERVDQLFKPFSQLESSAARAYSGTGVGLAIAKDLVGLMQGEVGVRSTKGEGSTFWFTAKLEKRSVTAESVSPPLPAPAVSSTRSAPAGSLLDDEARARRSTQRILIVEDNPVNQKMASVVLKKAGWACEIAEDGRRAVDLAGSEAYDLILMDCQMPRMDGFEATCRIRASAGRTPRTVPIVALTANAFDTDREACLRAGMDDFIAKPFRAPELVEVIERWIGIRSHTRVR